MNIPYVSFAPMHNELRNAMYEKFSKVYENNYFITGPELEAFEKEFADYCGAKYAVGCGNGLDALYLILKAFGIGTGDEVIVPSSPWIPSPILSATTANTSTSGQTITGPRWVLTMLTKPCARPWAWMLFPWISSKLWSRATSGALSTERFSGLRS